MKKFYKVITVIFLFAAVLANSQIRGSLNRQKQEEHRKQFEKETKERLEDEARTRRELEERKREFDRANPIEIPHSEVDPNKDYEISKYYYYSKHLFVPKDLVLKNEITTSSKKEEDSEKIMKKLINKLNLPTIREEFEETDFAYFHTKEFLKNYSDEKVVLIRAQPLFFRNVIFFQNSKNGKREMMEVEESQFVPELADIFSKLKVDSASKPAVLLDHSITYNPNFNRLFNENYSKLYQLDGKGVISKIEKKPEKAVVSEEIAINEKSEKKSSFFPILLGGLLVVLGAIFFIIKRKK